MGTLGNLLARPYVALVNAFLKYENKRDFEALKKWIKTDDLLNAHVKQSRTIDVRKYGIAFSAGFEDYGYRRPFPEIWWETRLGFVLTYEDQAIACIGYVNMRPGLLIAQVQGVKGKKELLAPLHWEKLLFACVTLHARELAKPEVACIPAKRNPFYNRVPGEPPLTDEELEARRARMRLLYDRTARKLGFVWFDDLNLYRYYL